MTIQICLTCSELDLFDRIDTTGKPVFLKFYESWCTHCKAMQDVHPAFGIVLTSLKTFMKSATMFKDRVTFMEAECGKDEKV